MAELRTTTAGEPAVRTATRSIRREPSSRHRSFRPSPIASPVALAAAAGLTLASALHEAVPLAAPLVVLATLPAVLVDIAERRLPNRLVAAAGALAVALIALSFALGLQPNVVGAVLGSAAMSVPLLAMHLVSPSSMGFGDVKLATVLGAALGLVAPLLSLAALAIGCAGAATVGLARRQRHIAFGPALASGAAAALLLAASPVELIDTSSAPDDVPAHRGAWS